MSWVTPVTNRTNASFLNIADLNRIKGNGAFLGTRFCVTITDTGTWTTSQIPVANDYAKYITLCNELKGARGIVVPADIDNTPARPLMTYTKWNKIENIMKTLYEANPNTIDDLKSLTLAQMETHTNYDLQNDGTIIGG